MNLDFRSEQAVQGALAYELACRAAGQGAASQPATQPTPIRPSMSAPVSEPLQAA